MTLHTRLLTCALATFGLNLSGCDTPDDSQTSATARPIGEAAGADAEPGAEAADPQHGAGDAECPDDAVPAAVLACEAAIDDCLGAAGLELGEGDEDWGDEDWSDEEEGEAGEDFDDGGEDFDDEGGVDADFDDEGEGHDDEGICEEDPAVEACFQAFDDCLTDAGVSPEDGDDWGDEEAGDEGEGDDEDWGDEDEGDDAHGGDFDDEDLPEDDACMAEVEACFEGDDEAAVDACLEAACPDEA